MPVTVNASVKRTAVNPKAPSVTGIENLITFMALLNEKKFVILYVNLTIKYGNRRDTR